MSHRLLCLLLLTFVGGTAGAQEQEQGLLLGLRYQESISKVPPYYAGRADSLSRSAYHTLLIAKREGRITLVGDADGLLVPRSTGFWRVSAKRSVYNDWVEDFIWAAPVGRPPRYPGIQPYNGEYCQGSRAQRILFAGENYLALEQYSAGYCEGAAHPWIFNTLAVVPIDSTTHMGLDITDILGETGHNALYAAAESYLESIPDADRRELFAEEPDLANWALTRREGRWVVVGRLDAISEVAQGTYADFEVPLPPPQSLAGRNQLAVPWAKVKSTVPDAVDAFSAPAQDFVVIVQRSRLTAHPVANGEIEPAVLTLRLRPETRPVMARWAVGARVQRWVDRFDRSPAPSTSASHR